MFIREIDLYIFVHLYLFFDHGNNDYKCNLHKFVYIEIIDCFVYIENTDISISCLFLVLFYYDQRESNWLFQFSSIS